MITPFQTAEKRLLAELANGKIKVTKLNDIALTKARDDGYVLVIGGYAIISHSGRERLDELQD